MKKDNIIFITALLGYSLLFFKQGAGINFLMFNLLMLILLLVKQPFLVFNKAWLWVAAGSILASINIVWQHTTLAIIAHVLSMLVLAGLSLYPRVSFLIALLNSLYSFVASVIMKIVDMFSEAKPKIAHTRVSSSLELKVMVPPLLTAVFMFIYREANPAFKSLTDGLFASWVSEEWVKFTFAGFLLLFGFFHQIALEPLTQKDMLNTDELTRKKQHLKRLFTLPALRTEYQLGWLSFGLLNLLLLFVNGTDVYYLLITGILPEGVAYAEYVHQGVYALILSVVMAIAVILYYFRVNLNFYAKNHSLKLLAYAWIAQNIVLVCTTAAKTSLYVAEYSLTYKRIGVFVYLLLTVIGLVITFIKIYSIKNNWFLFRKISWAFYIVLILATTINWSRLITHYNLSHLKNFREVDITYLVYLPDTNTDLLNNLVENSPQQLTEVQRMAIKNKRIAFLERYDGQEWQSWNYDSYRTAKSLEK